MSDSEGAAGSGGNGNGAPPGSGSQDGEGGWKPPSDGSWLPKVRVDEMVTEARARAHAAAEEVAGLRAQLEAERSRPPKEEAPKAISRTDLNQLVADGKITQDAADAHWERQIMDAAKKEGRAEAAAEFAGQQRELTVKRQFDEYRQLVPAAWEPGAKERVKVEREFKALVGMGFPDNKVTEVAALRAAFGDPQVIRAARSEGRNGPGEAHVEVGGGDAPGSGSGSDDGPPRGLDARKRDHYQRLINQGIVKDWKAAKEELKFVKAKA